MFIITGQKFGMGCFGPQILGGFVGSPRDFLGLIFAPIRSSLSLEILSTPWGITMTGLIYDCKIQVLGLENFAG